MKVVFRNYFLAGLLIALTAFAVNSANAHDSLNVSRIARTYLSPLENQLAISGNYAYAACGGSGLQVIDISNLEQPQNVYAVWDDIAVSIALGGQYLYVGYFGNTMDGMRVFSLTNPAAPEEVFNYQDGSIYYIAISGNLAFIGAVWGSEFQVLDISNPASPALIGSYAMANGTHAKDIALSGSYAYIAAAELGLVVLNVSNPSSPQYVGSFDMPDNNIFSISITGTTAFVSDLRMTPEASALRAIDISNPASPQLIGSLPANATSLDISGNYAYVTDIVRGLRVLNIANPANMTEVGYYDAPGAMAIEMQGQTAFTSVYPFFDIYDCSAAASLIERVGDVVPDDFALTSSFPNPFNSSATILYQIAQASQVELKVFDVVGKEVKTLVDFHQSPGKYQVQFDASDLASGTYFAQLVAGEFTQTHKTMLVK